MKPLSYAALALMLSACNVQPRPSCPWLGVDVNNPDFYQPLAPQTIDAVYNCELGRTNRYDQYVQTDLRYQWNLWRRVALREITPGMAQQDWIVFSNDHAYQQGQLDAAQRSSYRSYSSGGGSRSSYKSRDRDRGHGGGSRPSSHAPRPGSKLPSIPGIPTSSLTPPVPPTVGAALPAVLAEVMPLVSPEPVAPEVSIAPAPAADAPVAEISRPQPELSSEPEPAPAPEPAPIPSHDPAVP